MKEVTHSLEKAAEMILHKVSPAKVNVGAQRVGSGTTPGGTHSPPHRGKFTRQVGSQPARCPRNKSERSFGHSPQVSEILPHLHPGAAQPPKRFAHASTPWT